MKKVLWKNCANGRHIQSVSKGKGKELSCKLEGGSLCECECHKKEAGKEVTK